MSTNSKKIFNIVKSYILISFGLFIYALGWTAFLIPSGIVGGGVTGISTLIYFSTGFPVGFGVLIINAGLVLIAIRILGAKFGLNTIFGIVTSSIFFLILPQYITEAVVKDPFMATLLGAMLSGAGVGIAFINGGNSGGTDIIALIINKYRNISPGRIILYIDVLIISSSYLIFHSIEKLVFSAVLMGVFSYTLDLLIEGAKQSYQIMVFSKENKSIADRIGMEVGRGITLLHAQGWYTKQENEVLMVIARKHDKERILKIINESDPKAFISVAKVMGVFGTNFDKVKL